MGNSSKEYFDFIKSVKDDKQTVKKIVGYAALGVAILGGICYLLTRKK